MIGDGDVTRIIGFVGLGNMGLPIALRLPSRNDDFSESAASRSGEVAAPAAA